MRFELLAAADARIVPLIALQNRLAEMFAAGYQCVGVLAGPVANESTGQLLGLAGFSVRTHCFSGRVMYVENVVLLPEARGAGAGQALMRWLEARALRAGCTMVTLDCYAKNLRAQTFYTRLDYDARGVHFVKDLVC
jgi:diamine N-acetyltransferase